MKISRDSKAHVLGALAAAVLVLITGCSRPPAEERLRAVIDEMRSAIEGGNRRQFMNHVNENFSGEGGQWDREQLDRVIRGLMFQHKSIDTTMTNLDIQFFDKRATATMKVLITGGPSAWRPSNAEFIDVSSGWLDSDDGWQLISADWQ